MTRPSDLPDWDTSEVNSVEPDTTHKEQGWIAPGGIPEKPPFQTFNYWMNLVFKWLSWLNINVSFLANSIADLRLLDGGEGSGKASVAGYYAAGDGGGGDFYWDAASTETDNGGTVIKVTAVTTGRWKRLYSGAVNAQWFGNTAAGLITAATINAMPVDIDSDIVYDSAANPSNVNFNMESSVLGYLLETIDVVTKTDDDTVIGLGHNHREERILTGEAANLAGLLGAPPVSQTITNSPIDILAHWFNDFGMDCVRQDNSFGSSVWYDWSWNHTDAPTKNVNNEPYDNKRHPLLGWYRGDDAAVLDWQCYWLKESGVKAAILYTTNRFKRSTWADPATRGYWMYNLFNHTPNFKRMGYIIGGPYGYSAEHVDAAALEAEWNSIITNIYLTYQHFYTTEINGESYPCIYIHDTGTLRTLMTTPVFETWLKDMAATFQGLGYGGVCVLGRNASTYTEDAAVNATAFSGSGVFIFEVDYGNFSGSYAAPAVYSDYTDNFGGAYRTAKAASPKLIPNVMTARESKYPHPSGWTTGGSTPALFRKVLTDAVNEATNNENIPPMVTVYNVAEWAEGGAGLQPTHGDGFGYLNAISMDNKSSKRSFTGQEAGYSKSVTTGTGTAGNNIKPDAAVLRLSSGFGVTLNGTYVAYQNGTIAPGVDGQTVTLLNVGAFLIRIADVSSYANSYLYLEAATVDLNPWDSIQLTYIAAKSGWVQTGNLVNIL